MQKKTWITILLVFLFLVGLSLLLYPSVADYWNKRVQSTVIATFMETVRNMDDERKAQIWEEAVEYNEELKKRGNPYTLTNEMHERYFRTLDISGTGTMGYIDIPAMNVTIPVYHGTSESVLQRYIGHMEWTYLPVGGEGTHCVVSGHRGLPSARLFTDLGKLVVGDLIMFQILDETLTYEVDQILTVLPSDVAPLEAVPGEDYVTLVTCTPYGVNTHRMLVRAHRIENPEATRVVRVVSEAIQIEPLVIAPAIGIPLIILLLIYIAVRDIRTQRKKREMKKLNELLRRK